MLNKHEANPQENNNGETQSQKALCNLLKSHSGTDMPPRIRSTSLEQHALGECHRGTAYGCQKQLKKIELKNIFCSQLLKEIH